jgi:hypothetical protein
MIVFLEGLVDPRIGGEVLEVEIGLGHRRSLAPQHRRADLLDLGVTRTQRGDHLDERGAGIEQVICQQPAPDRAAAGRC